MNPKEFEDWLNKRMDYYAEKAIEEENNGNIDEMNRYGFMFDATRDAYYKFDEVQEWIKENVITKTE